MHTCSLVFSFTSFGVSDTLFFSVSIWKLKCDKGEDNRLKNNGVEIRELGNRSFLISGINTDN